MAKWKVTKVYQVEALTKIEAREKFVAAVRKGTEEELLEYVSVKPVVEASGWKQQIKQSLLGS